MGLVFLERNRTELVAQLSTQSGNAAMDVDLHGPNGAPKGEGDFLVRETHDVAEQDGITLPTGELAQRGDEGDAQRRCLDCVPWGRW
jgi:autotransporter translocation and assembly factor TamB